MKVVPALVFVLLTLVLLTRARSDDVDFESSLPGSQRTWKQRSCRGHKLWSWSGDFKPKTEDGGKKCQVGYASLKDVADKSGWTSSTPAECECNNWSDYTTRVWDSKKNSWRCQAGFEDTGVDWKDDKNTNKLMQCKRGKTAITQAKKKYKNKSGKELAKIAGTKYNKTYKESQKKNQGSCRVEFYNDGKLIRTMKKKGKINVAADYAVLKGPENCFASVKTNKNNKITSMSKSNNTQFVGDFTDASVTELKMN